LDTSGAIDADIAIKHMNNKSYIECITSLFFSPFSCFFGLNDGHDELRKRNEDNDNEEVRVCLQRKIIIDNQGNQQDLVKFNYKCIDNNLNKWYIKESGNSNYYTIVSLYDYKCLKYDSENDMLTIQECEKNNKYEEFTIKNNVICTRIDEKKCLNGFDIYPSAKIPQKYENLNCSINFAVLGFPCCSPGNTKVEYVDKIGNWGTENGKLCGIGYERCSFSVLDEPYPCCSSINPEIVYTDENGDWGNEDGEWCGIGEAKLDSSFRIRNRKTQECLITNLHSDILMYF